MRSPAAVAEAACLLGRHKVEQAPGRQFVLGILAGAYIALGGMLALVVGKGSPALAAANPGLAQLAAGAVFPLGLILVVLAGAELFTGNCAVVFVGYLRRQVGLGQMLRNWAVVYGGNFVGAVLVAAGLAYGAGVIHGGTLGAAAAAVAEHKVSLGWGTLLLSGIGCNWLVCLAVWLALATDDLAGKMLGIWFPIMTFVTLGFEHSVANMFFIPLGMINGAAVDVGQFLLSNLLPVTLGNIVGGAIFVAAAYCWCYPCSSDAGPGDHEPPAPGPADHR